MSDFNRFRELLSYCEKTGEFTWKKRGNPRFDSQYAGKKAGTVHVSSTGRKSIKISVDGKNYFAHRLAFLLKTGSWPKHVVDHVDQNPLNNRWCNLRDVTQKENSRNRSMNSRNRSGYPNVYRDGKKWVAKVMPAGVLCRVSCPKEASRIAEEYKASIGYSRNHGKNRTFQ